jgi:hypothetical protein
MKHATPNALAQLSGLLTQIRARPGLKEKKLGIFYRKSKSFLHFHEDPAGLFADLSAADSFTRYPVNTCAEQTEFLKALDNAVSDETSQKLAEYPGWAKLKNP